MTVEPVESPVLSVVSGGRSNTVILMIAVAQTVYPPRPTMLMIGPRIETDGEH